MYTVLIFYPGDESYVGVWQSHDAVPWQTVPVAFGQTNHNALVSAVGELLKTTSLTLKQLTHIGIMRGPASYTQLRSFVAAANSIAWANQVPLFDFPSDVMLPDTLASYVSAAHRNIPIEPLYPHPVS